MLIRTLTLTASSAVLLSTLVSSAFSAPIYSANTVSNIKANSGVIAQNNVQIKRNLLQGRLPIVRVQDRYAAIWVKAPNQSSWVARHGLSSAQYQATFDDLVAKGYRLVHVSGYSVNGQDKYAAIWIKSGGSAWVARHGLSSAQYQATFDDLVAKGYRLVDVSGYSVNGQDKYAAIWEKSGGSAWVARHGLSSAQYQATFDDLVGKGYRLVRVSGYSVNGQDRYAAIWEKSGGSAWVARHGLTSAQYQANFDKFVGEGYQLVDVSGYSISP
jgi:Bacterial tandem repeat domain 1